MNKELARNLSVFCLGMYVCSVYGMENLHEDPVVHEQLKRQYRAMSRYKATPDFQQKKSKRYKSRRNAPAIHTVDYGAFIDALQTPYTGFGTQTWKMLDDVNSNLYGGRSVHLVDKQGNIIHTIHPKDVKAIGVLKNKTQNVAQRASFESIISHSEKYTIRPEDHDKRYRDLIF